MEGTELYKYDGANFPVRIKINSGANPGGSEPSNFFIYNNRLYFSARPGAADYLMYTIDTAGNYSPAPGASGFTDAGAACVTQGKVYFSAMSATHGRELWSYDSTTALRVTDIAPGTASALSSRATPPTFYNGKVYFAASAAGVPYQLYAYDPATAATALVDTASLGNFANDFVPKMMVHNNSLYYVAYTPASGIELWSYNGATAALYADIIPGSDSSFYSRESGGWSRITPGFTEFNGHLYFIALVKP